MQLPGHCCTLQGSTSMTVRLLSRAVSPYSLMHSHTRTHQCYGMAEHSSSACQASSKPAPCDPLPILLSVIDEVTSSSHINPQQTHALPAGLSCPSSRAARLCVGQSGPRRHPRRRRVRPSLPACPPLVCVMTLASRSCACLLGHIQLLPARESRRAREGALCLPSRSPLISHPAVGNRSGT